MIRIVTSGRRDIEEYFKLSGIREVTSLPHNPFLAFIASHGKVEVKIVERPSDLLSFPDDTPVMSQWSGKWRSDFFQFSVKELKDYIVKNPPESYQKI